MRVIEQGLGRDARLPGWEARRPSHPESRSRDRERCRCRKLGTAMCVCDATEDHEDDHDGEGGMHLTGWPVADDLHQHVEVLDDVQSTGRGEWG